jgi:hypothetical protein
MRRRALEPQAAKGALMLNADEPNPISVKPEPIQAPSSWRREGIGMLTSGYVAERKVRGDKRCQHLIGSGHLLSDIFFSFASD